MVAARIARCQKKRSPAKARPARTRAGGNGRGLPASRGSPPVFRTASRHRAAAGRARPARRRSRTDRHPRWRRARRSARRPSRPRRAQGQERRRRRRCRRRAVVGDGSVIRARSRGKSRCQTSYGRLRPASTHSSDRKSRRRCPPPQPCMRPIPPCRPTRSSSSPDRRPSGALILCDHASNAVPPDFGDLGLPAVEFERHIAYDIGAAAVTRALARLPRRPGGPDRFSRLVIDPNRGRDDPTLVMRLSDGAVVPGNARVDGAEIERRIAPLLRALRRRDRGSDRACGRGPASRPA